MNANSGETLMRKITLAIASGIALTFATAALADDAMSTPQPEQMAQPISATTSNDASQVVCHHLVHQGTMMPKPVCLTKQTWERIRLQTQKTVSDFENHSYVTPNAK
jgi:hypothetical protein